MSGFVLAPTAASRLIASSIGEYPAFVADPTTHAPMNAAGPTTPPTAANLQPSASWRSRPRACVTVPWVAVAGRWMRGPQTGRAAGELLAQRARDVVAAVDAAPLQLGHEEVDDVGVGLGKDLARDVEPVHACRVHPLLELVGDIVGRADDERARSGQRDVARRRVRRPPGRDLAAPSIASVEVCPSSGRA